MNLLNIPQNPLDYILYISELDSVCIMSGARHGGEHLQIQLFGRLISSRLAWETQNKK